MNEKALVIQYLGHKVTSDSREYSFAVRASEGDPREFSLSILNEAFDARLVRFQDAAEICSIRLRQELHATPRMEGRSFCVTNDDLQAYRAAHAPKRPGGFFSRNA